MKKLLFLIFSIFIIQSAEINEKFQYVSNLNNDICSTLISLGIAKGPIGIIADYYKQNILYFDLDDKFIHKIKLIFYLNNKQQEVLEITKFPCYIFINPDAKRICIECYQRKTFIDFNREYHYIIKETKSGKIITPYKKNLPEGFEFLDYTTPFCLKKIKA